MGNTILVAAVTDQIFNFLILSATVTIASITISALLLSWAPMRRHKTPRVCCPSLLPLSVFRRHRHAASELGPDWAGRENVEGIMEYP